jgi:hypothetical protein
LGAEQRNNTTLFGRVCLLDTDRTILVTKVSGNGLLTTLAASSLDLVTVGTEEETNFKNTRNRLDLVGKSSDFPLTIFARSIRTILDIILSEKRLEGGVDDVETLIGLDGTSLCKSVFAEYRVDGSNELELAHNGSMSNRSNLDRY